MKKILILSILLLSLGITGCQSNDTKESVTKDDLTVTSQQEDIEKVETVPKKEESTPEKQNTETTTDIAKDSNSLLNLGEVKNCNDIIELQFDSSEWLDTILPTNTSSFYSYYEDVEGESYFVLKGSIKNISADTIDIKFGSLNSFKFNDKYTYTGSFEAEGKDKSDFFGYQLAPLTSATCYLYVSVPDEMKDNYEKCDIELGFSDLKSYVFNKEDCTNLYTISTN